MKLIHGGDIYSDGFSPDTILDFSANINPLGIPKGVKEVLMDNVDQCVHYPDPLCRELRGAISTAEGINPDWFVFGNGAADLIFRLVLALKPKKALLTAPTFAEYGEALAVWDCEIRTHQLNRRDGFQLKEDYLQQLTEDLDLIFLCNPNNPTGQLIHGPLLKKILERCREKNITMVVDECFLGFLPSKEAVTLKSFLGEFPNLFLLRAFTKDYALPGIRLGYGMSSSVECIEAIQRVGQPWSVSLLAQAAGVQALKESLYREQTQQLIEEEKEYLFQELKRLGYYVLYPAANYIFFCLPKGGKERIAAFVEGLKEKGILIRNCGNYLGLGEEDGYFRVAVKSHQENIQLVNALNASEQ